MGGMEIREVPEGFRWVVYGKAGSLHRLAWIPPDGQGAYFSRTTPHVQATAVCGLNGEFHMPNEYQRAGLHRCCTCNLKLGLPNRPGAVESV